MEAWGTENGGSKSASLSVKFTDADNLTAFVGTAYSGLSITGSSSASFSSNTISIGEYITDSYVFEDNDTLSFSQSTSKKIDFRSTDVTSSDSDYAGWKVRGIITVEAKSNMQTKIKSVTPDHSEGSQGGLDKVSVILSITDGTKAAKFKLSYAMETDMSARNLKGGYTIMASDIEVYRQNNTPLFTIYGSESANLLSRFSSRFIDFGD